MPPPCSIELRNSRWTKRPMTIKPSKLEEQDALTCGQPAARQVPSRPPKMKIKVKPLLTFKKTEMYLACNPGIGSGNHQQAKHNFASDGERRHD